MRDVVPGSRPGPHLRRWVPVAVAALVLGTAGGVAYSAWQVTAAGSSQAASETISVGTVAVATPAAKLYPGATTSLYFTVTNPNAFPVTYNAVSFGSVSVDDATACPVAGAGGNVSVATTALSVSVPAGGTSTVQAAGAITMAGSAPAGCAGRTFTVATTVTGTST